MFSSNGKISEEQAVRMLILDVFTSTCLFLPMALPRVAGNGGGISCVVGFIWIALEGKWLSKFTENNEKVRWGFFLRCFVTYIFLMSLFVQVLSDTFLYTMPKWLIISGIVAVLIYGSMKGIEVRARLSEILFYLSLIPIVFIGLFSLPEAEWSRLVNFREVSLGGIIEGALITWVLMTPIEWFFYMKKDISYQEDKSKYMNVFYLALGIGGGLILLIYGICQAVLSVEGMISERWPTVILMQIIKIPGGFLSRQDGLMLSFWIFAMYMSLSGALEHAVCFFDGNDHMSLKKNQFKLKVILSIGGSLIACFTGMERAALNVYFYIMIISGVLFLWILPYIQSRNRKKLMTCLIVSGICLWSLSGCETNVELENREFLMVIGVDKGTMEDYCFSFAFPDLGQITGNGSDEKKKPVVLEADCLKSAESQLNSMSEKMTDYGQVKVILLGADLLKDVKLIDKLSEEIKNMPNMARTILMCGSETTAKDIVFMDENIRGSVGMYLESLLKNHKKEVIFNAFYLSKSAKELPKVHIVNEKIILNNPDESCKIK